MLDESMFPVTDIAIDPKFNLTFLRKKIVASNNGALGTFCEVDIYLSNRPCLILLVSPDKEKGPR